MENEKSKPLLSFNIIVPVRINIPISAKPDYLRRLNKQLTKKGQDKTTYMNKWLLKRLRKSGVKGYDDLLKQSGNHKLVKNSIKDSITGSFGTSNTARYIVEEQIKEWDKDEKG